MKLLALDSAMEACSAALYVDGIVQERFELAPRQHARLLLPLAHALLKQAGIKLTELDALAFGHGPGSFTGIRIALGIVQGLALGCDRPVVGISTLAALAARALTDDECAQAAVAVDARMNQVYWGTYRRDTLEGVVLLDAEVLLEPVQVPRLSGGDWRAIGTGWIRHADALQQASGLDETSVHPELYPHAAEIARLAVGQIARGAGVAAAMAHPVYLRDQVAQKMSNKR